MVPLRPEPLPHAPDSPKLESVLRYRRPFLEDGTIEYEFFHEPDKTIVHPALDRLAFLLTPNGVALHRLTDTPHERAGLKPGNIVLDPASKRSPEKIPLRPKQWNHLKIELIGDQVRFELNGVLIDERTLEPSTGRMFGLFHFADESEARVRNVVYRGLWSKTLPEPRNE